MEMGYLVRTPLCRSVEVFQNQRFLGRFETRDIDVGGVFIKTRMSSLKPDDVVRMVFLIPDGGRCKHALRAGVARVEPEGVGLMLLDREDIVFGIISAAIPRKAVRVSRTLPSGPKHTKNCPALAAETARSRGRHYRISTVVGSVSRKIRGE